MYKADEDQWFDQATGTMQPSKTGWMLTKEVTENNPDDKKKIHEDIAIK